MSTDSVWPPPFPCGEGRFSNAVLVLVYHFKGFLIGCVYTTLMALLFAGVDYAILRFVIWG